MSKRKNYRFRCPVCGLLIWESRLGKRYPLELVDVQSDGRGLIKNIFFAWDSNKTLQPAFEEHFYGVLRYLLERGYIDASVVKNIVGVFESIECLRPLHVHVPTHVHNPIHVHKPKRM